MFTTQQTQPTHDVRVTDTTAPAYMVVRVESWQDIDTGYTFNRDELWDTLTLDRNQADAAARRLNDEQGFDHESTSGGDDWNTHTLKFEVAEVTTNLCVVTQL